MGIFSFSSKRTNKKIPRELLSHQFLHTKVGFPQGLLLQLHVPFLWGPFAGFLKILNKENIDIKNKPLSLAWKAAHVSWWERVKSCVTSVIQPHPRGYPTGQEPCPEALVFLLCQLVWELPSISEMLGSEGKVCSQLKSPRFLNQHTDICKYVQISYTTE